MVNMLPKRCLICCGERFPKKTATQDGNSTYLPSAKNFNCQQAEGIDNADTELQIIFLLRKLLEIPDSTFCLLREHFGKASVWIECCDSCLDLVEKCKTALEQAELFQKQYEELRSNIKTTMLKSQKTFISESKCEVIVRSILITQEIDTFINTNVGETDEEVFPNGNTNFNPNSLPAAARSQETGTQVLFGSIPPMSPVLFEMINTVKSEDEISISSNDNDDLESSDFGNNVQSGNSVCGQNNCETIQSDNLNKFGNHNLEQFVVSPKSNESPGGSKCSQNTTEKQTVSKGDGKGDAEKKHECHICLQLFKLPQELKTHLRSHSGSHKNTFRKRKGNLRNHPNKHTGDKKHECDICGKSFREFYRLKIHRRIHSGEKPFECDICGKGFISAAYLKNHCIWHSGERSFECDVCGKTFVTKKHLNIHQATHSQKRPFKCDICGKSFKSKYNLSRHRKMHDEETN